MPSPDFSQYVDLTLYDKSPSELYLNAVDYAQTVALPEFNPRVGSIEDALLQAVSFATAELAGTINRLPDGLMEGILNLYGFERQQSVSARITVNVTVVDSAGATIPAGALFSYTSEGDEGLETYFFATVQDLVVAVGDTTGTVEAEALVTGIMPTLSDGTDLTLVSGVSRILSASTSGDMTQGEEEETDISYFTRGAAFLASRSNSLATSTQIQNYLPTYVAEIQRAYVSDLTRFKYMRVSSVTRTGEVVTAVIDGLGSSWDTPTDTLTFLSTEVTAGDRVIVRYANDTEADVPINGTATSGTPYTVLTATYSVSEGTFTLEFQTSVSADVAQEYLPMTTAPHHYHEEVGHVEGDTYIEILLVPDDYNEVAGHVGLVFGNSSAAPLETTGYLNVQNEIRGKSIAGLTFTSIAPILVPVTINAEIEHLASYGAVSVRQAVETALSEYVSAESWAFGKNIYVNNLIGVAASVAGVSRVASLTLSISTSDFSDLAEYSALEGGYITFAYPFCLPTSTVTVSGVA